MTCTVDVLDQRIFSPTTTQSAVFDRRDPCWLATMRVDPSLEIDEASMSEQIRDYERPSRRYLLPIVRPLSMLGAHLVLFVKNFLPFEFASQAALISLGSWFLHRFASPETLGIILRHYAIETNLINFVARNCGAADVKEVDLLPRTIDDLGDVNGLSSVVQHDINIYNLVLDIGFSKTANVKDKRPLEELDFSCLNIPDFSGAKSRGRWMNLDLDTSLYILLFFLALFLTRRETERAVNSFQLDATLLGFIGNLTGDPAFYAWAPMKYTNWLGKNWDIGRDLHCHMIANEYAHSRLVRMRDTKQNS